MIRRIARSIIIDLGIGVSTSSDL